jgi:hypothetical protein
VLDAVAFYDSILQLCRPAQLRLSAQTRGMSGSLPKDVRAVEPEA